MEFIKFRNVEKTYKNGVNAVYDMNLDIKKGEFVFVIGASGSGKLLPKLTVYENVAFALEIYGLPTNEVQRKVLKALDLVGLKSKTKSYPNQLSGGEQQRVAIARAIVNSPKLLICDEPTGNLDPDTSLEVMKVIEKINDLGTTVVMATHDREMVNKMKKRVVLLDNGKLVKDYEKGSYTHYESN